MKKYRILVTGVGAVIGYGIIKALRNSGYDLIIIGMDIYEDAVGQKWCDSFYQALRADDKNYICFLKNFIVEKEIDLVFFGTEQEIIKVSNNREEFGNNISKLVINRKEVIELAQDKWLMHQFLSKNGLSIISTAISGEYNELKKNFGQKILLKPRSSSASKGIIIVDNEGDFDYWKLKMGEQFMAQKIIGSDEQEYTVAVFGYRNEEYTKPICLKRKLGLGGATTKAQIVSIEELEHQAKCIVELLKPVGPTNLQFRLHNGKYLLLEVNPRISSSISIRTLFGFNEAKLCIDYFLEGRKAENIEFDSGTVMRYIADIII